MSRIPVAVLGAGGAVGQRFVSLLDGHPWFELAAVTGEASAGKPYGEAVRWLPDAPLPDAAARLTVGRDVPAGVPVVFSALPAGVAGPVESAFAARGHRVFTNARDHRMDPLVPLVIPEVNGEALDLVRRQPGPGFIAANGNCTAIVLTLALAPLHRAFGLEEVHVTSLQGLSGAGYPGVPALDIVDNVLPLIPGEEQKVEAEPAKMLGSSFAIHATCTRAAVREGHFEAVHVRLARPATLAEARSAFDGFRGPPDVQGLPSAPKRPIHVHDAPDRPQPRRDRDAEGGMAVSVGRLRLSADGRLLRFVALGSNTVRGAAGASLLNAELARVRGLL